jgi:uncharacterized protein YjiS (DUF1127 family)
MTDQRFITLRERTGQNTGRQSFSRRFRFTLGRACSLWRKAPGYLDRVFERRRSAEARAAERALLRLDDRTLRDIGVKRCDLLAMAYGLSCGQVVSQDRDGMGSSRKGEPKRNQAARSRAMGGDRYRTEASCTLGTPATRTKEAHHDFCRI